MWYNTSSHKPKIGKMIVNMLHAVNIKNMTINQIESYINRLRAYAIQKENQNTELMKKITAMPKTETVSRIFDQGYASGYADGLIAARSKQEQKKPPVTEQKNTGSSTDYSEELKLLIRNGIDPCRVKIEEWAASGYRRQGASASFVSDQGNHLFAVHDTGESQFQNRIAAIHSLIELIKGYDID